MLYTVMCNKFICWHKTSTFIHGALPRVHPVGGSGYGVQLGLPGHSGRSAPV